MFPYKVVFAGQKREKVDESNLGSWYWIELKFDVCFDLMNVDPRPENRPVLKCWLK